MIPGLLIARLNQAPWTPTPNNFYHPNKFSIRCIVSFNYWSTLSLGVVVKMCWFNLAIASTVRCTKKISLASLIIFSYVILTHIKPLIPLSIINNSETRLLCIVRCIRSIYRYLILTCINPWYITPHFLIKNIFLRRIKKEEVT